MQFSPGSQQPSPDRHWAPAFQHNSFITEPQLHISPPNSHLQQPSKSRLLSSHTAALTGAPHPGQSCPSFTDLTLLPTATLPLPDSRTAPKAWKARLLLPPFHFGARQWHLSLVQHCHPSIQQSDAITASAHSFCTSQQQHLHEVYILYSGFGAFHLALGNNYCHEQIFCFHTSLYRFSSARRLPGTPNDTDPKSLN